MKQQSLGERLKDARKGRAVDDVVDAYKARWGKHRGISRGSLPRWEKDESQPNEIVLARLAKLYGVPLETLDPEASAAILEFSPPGVNDDEWAARDSNPESAESMLCAA